MSKQEWYAKHRVVVQVPGDLDPRVSPHYLTTMKKAYLKLRYLVDSGCIFVGHDLRHDFKSINIIVPPQQVSHGVAGRLHLAIECCMLQPTPGTSVVMSAHRFVRQPGLTQERSGFVTIDMCLVLLCQNCEVMMSAPPVRGHKQ